MTMFTRDTVTIVTAATGHPDLARCLRSVQQQTYPDVEHIVVVDGLERDSQVRAAVATLKERTRPIHIISLPYPTGLENWNGHRIYAGMSFLSNTEFISFLDEDNWIDPDHVESLIAAIRTAGSMWAFSLRKIVDPSGKFLAVDHCESLGNLHHVFNNREDFHVDTNCYMLRREVAAEFAPAWYSPTFTPAVSGSPLPSPGKMEPDRVLCRSLLRYYPQAGSNRKPTLNYTVGSRPDSVQADFFLRGNQVMANAYPGGLPWEHT